MHPNGIQTTYTFYIEFFLSYFILSLYFFSCYFFFSIFICNEFLQYSESLAPFGHKFIINWMFLSLWRPDSNRMSIRHCIRDLKCLEKITSNTWKLGTSYLEIVFFALRNIFREWNSGQTKWKLQTHSYAHRLRS